jgi:hypothetical protein
MEYRRGRMTQAYRRWGSPARLARGCRRRQQQDHPARRAASARSRRDPSDSRAHGPLTAKSSAFRVRDAARERVAFAGAPLADFALRVTRSGKRLDPVPRFQSSNVSFEILPSTNNCANFRRCAWLLNGMPPPTRRTPAVRTPAITILSGTRLGPISVWQSAASRARNEFPLRSTDNGRC